MKLIKSFIDSLSLKRSGSMTMSQDTVQTLLTHGLRSSLSWGTEIFAAHLVSAWRDPEP